MKNKELIEQQIEQCLRNHIPSATVLSEATREDISCAVRQVMRDNPDIFWFSHQWEYKEGRVSFHYALEKEQSEKGMEQIKDVIKNDFRMEEVRKLTTAEQVMYVYKWIALYCRYNIHSAHNQTIYSVFVYRNSVCTGIAKAAQYLLQLLGIESRLIFGKMDNSEADSRHCWLTVKVDEKWYHLDPTFAMPETEKILRESGTEPTVGADSLFYNFFCTDTSAIRQSRTIEEEELLPHCDGNIGYTRYQDIDVAPSRNGNAGGLGCLLSDSGSTSEIYLAHNQDKHCRRQSVAKVFKNDPDHELLRKELAVASENTIRHILHATNADFNKGILYIEQATPLAAILASNYFKLTLDDFCLLILDVIAGLEELLAHGIVYRDIHLNNIYLTDDVENGRNLYKLGDFGSCTFTGKAEKYAGMTDRGGVGSKWYMAPETIRENLFDERSAVYVTGMMAYHLLNNLYPPLWLEYGERAHNLRMNRVRIPRPSLLMKPEYSNLDFPFLPKAISYEPSDRYESLDAFKTNILDFICGHQQGGNLLLISGGRFSSSPAQKTVEKFCSTCANPHIGVRKNIPVSYSPSAGNTRQEAEPSRSGQDAPRRTGGLLGRLRQLFTGNGDMKGESKQPQPSKVNASVFAPAETSPGDYMLVQVFLYQDGWEDAVMRKATEVDSQAIRRNFTPLSVLLKQGDTVRVCLNMCGEGVEITDEPVRELTWQGRLADCQFGVSVKDGFRASVLIGTVVVSVNGIPAGKMLFKTNVVRNPQNLYTNVECRTFHKIFISYSHKDEAQVKYIAEAYRAQGVDYFFDRHYLKAGDIYPVMIRQYIDSSDLFILCWSKNAAESEYVTLERRQALALAYPQVDPEKATLTIHPISIKPHAEYPEDMATVYNFEEV